MRGLTEATPVHSSWQAAGSSRTFSSGGVGALFAKLSPTLAKGRAVIRRRQGDT